MAVKLGGGAAAPAYLVDPATGAPYAATGGGGGGGGDASAANQATQITAEQAILAKLIAAPATEAKQDTQITALGSLTETAPASDIASSGLNGRLQRIAQNITTLIASVLKVGGNVASGATDSGNPVKVGGVYNSTPPTLTNGQRGDIQMDAQGGQKVSGTWLTPTWTNIVALNGDGIAAMDASAYRSFSLMLSGTWSATIKVQGSLDGTNWYDLRMLRTTDAIPFASVTASSLFYGAVPPGIQIRVRATSYTSGTVNGAFSLSALPLGPQEMSANISNQNGVGLPSPSSSYGNTDGFSAVVSLPPVAAFLEGFNGSTWDRIRSDAGKFLQVATAATLIKTATPTVSTTPAYSAGDNIGGLISLTSAVRYAAGGGTITSVVISDKAKQSAAIDVVFFTANPGSTTFTDNGALAVNAADLVSIVGVISVTSWSAFSANSVGSALGQSLPFVLASGTTLYAALVARGTPTYASTSDIQITVGILPD